MQGSPSASLENWKIGAQQEEGDVLEKIGGGKKGLGLPKSKLCLRRITKEYWSNFVLLLFF